ncbi:hypothetical protein AAG906_039501 [Vitis piasezkii]
MAFRGRGRGRGGYGRGGVGGFGIAKQEPFVLFPDIELPDVSSVPEEKNLVIWNARLQNYWKSSPYYLEDIVPRKSQSTDIERFSDRVKLRTTLKRDPLEQILRLTSDNFPLELLQGLQAEQLIRFFLIRNLYTELKDCSLHIELPGMKGATHNKRKVRWNPESDMQKLELFEKLEKKLEGQDEKGGKEKKEGENEDEDDEGGEEAAEEEFSDDGDYNQNIDFDDDEDDFNMEDDNDDEATY